MSQWLLSSSELDTLETLLDELPEELDLTLATLHGLVTGVAVLPITPTAEVWKTLLFHDTQPLQGDEAETFQELIEQWHQRVDRILQSGESFELPVELSLEALTSDLEDDDLDEDAMPSPTEEWCIGFVEAVVSGEAFDESLAERGDEITELTVPAAFVAGALDGTEWDEIYEKDDILVDLLAALPDMVTELYLTLRVQVVEGEEE